jgi:GT2 family glycosyltransferase
VPVKTSVIIVSHNSELFLAQNLANLVAQTLLPDEIIIVDSGSEDVAAIRQLISTIDTVPIKLISCKNVGFSKANNMGISQLSTDCSQVIFLNPDCFLSANFLSSLVDINMQLENAGLLTGKLAGYDIIKQQNTGLLDSTGIFQTRYGKWYDRGQGELDNNQYDNNQGQIVPAVCGALMICPKELIDLMIKNDGYFFNEDFFMYKEDIEVSLRIKKSGKKVLYFSCLVAHHCRGWQQDRSKVARWARLRSAKNDLTIAIKFRQRALVFASIKYFLVLVFDI